ncbi:hypothetical protein H8E52_01305 [bacterium]|nr:hypothetical protein [bacterium]
MKFRLSKTACLIWLGMLLFAGSALAFHEGGVASCEGCHLMHFSRDGQTMALGYSDLLIAETPSDVCLTCHADDHGSVFGNNPMAPPPFKGAGNFVFLLEDNINDAPDGATNPIPGYAAGHSIVAPSMGMGSDPFWGSSPGGSYPAHHMGCTSCHDPHGNENFRMLRSVGDEAPGGFIFSYSAPVAMGMDLDSFSEEAPDLHSAYLSGMSQWCANCHENYLQDDHDEHGASSFEHDTNRTFGDEAHNYNVYNGTADPSGGSQATAYLPEVPFESSSNTITSTQGPHPSDRMNCLTCHRAHASSAPHAGRWDFNVETLGQDGVVSGSYPLPNPYGDPAQRSLCEKCHEIEDDARASDDWKYHRFSGANR